MDRSWMKMNRLSVEYEQGVQNFISAATLFATRTSVHTVYCPCKKCWNKRLIRTEDLLEHLTIYGIDPSYTVWRWHGEDEASNAGEEVRHEENDASSPEEEGDELMDMLQQVTENFTCKPKMFNNLVRDAEKPLYPGCTKYTKLSVVLKLFNLKSKHGWSDQSFTGLLALLNDVLPDDNEMPRRTYDAKKLLCPMGSGYKRIHACRNDCILYRGKYEDSDKCPKCGAPRYLLTKDSKQGQKGSPAKVCWFLSPMRRFKQMFANHDDAQNLRWHAEKRICDGKLRHPADSEQWAKIDSMYPWFGDEPRNLRLGLSTDGVNPHGDLSSKHSTWPVFLTVYNLPPWLCMKRKHIMLTMLISGPRQPGNDIDVYLAPLIEELQMMWEEGVKTFDAYGQEYFTLRAMIFCTVNDFPAYGNLAGYSVKGYKGCPICMELTCSCYLKHWKKVVYLGSRRFLKPDHPYRKKRKAFNGLPEDEPEPVPLPGTDIFELVRGIEEDFGKPNKTNSESAWKKRSIFFDLPYWKHLFVRHCIDVMHVEKNICDSLVGTLLNVKGKTKDDANARLDMVEMNMRKELAPEKRGTRTYLPPACYTLSKIEKTSFCNALLTVKVPQGYSSNFRSLVSMKDLKLVGTKSHDCHTLMQQLLPVAIRGIMPKKLRRTITRLCFIFNVICRKVLDPQQLDALQSDVVVTLCEMEMFFPPSFFDIMVHLTVHLVREIKCCGPVHLRWMYPFERAMKTLKGYVRNRYRPEGSIVEGYIAEEAVEFCTNYLANTRSVGLPESRHEGRSDGKGLFGSRFTEISREERDQAHLYVLQHLSAVGPYVDEHVGEIRRKSKGKKETWIQSEHSRTFIPWFRNRIQELLAEDPSKVTEHVKWIASGPNVKVISYRGYDINGYCFYTKRQDDRSTMQNSGVTIVATALHVASSKDKNPIEAAMPYYGVIESIFEIDYSILKVPIFRCQWVDNSTGVRTDDMGFTLVDLGRQAPTNDPFILASQAKQVFYFTDPSNDMWSVVLQGKKQHVLDDDADDTDEDEYDASENLSDIPSFSSGMPPIECIEEDTTHIYVRADHTEGIWVDNEKVKRKKLRHGQTDIL